MRTALALIGGGAWIAAWITLGWLTDCGTSWPPRRPGRRHP
jgi:hypothetical protein